MVVNAVSPWEGQLVWVGTPSGGISQQNGQEWKSVEFTLKFTDTKLQESYITFNAFGLDRVAKLQSLPIGTRLRVTWYPESRRSTGNGGDERWWSKNQVFGITEIREAQTAPAPQPQAPQYGQQYPQQGTAMPQAPAYAPQPVQSAQIFPQKPQSFVQQTIGPDEDIPF